MYRTELFDNGSIEFVCAHHLKLTFTSYETYPVIEMLAKSKGFEGDLIEW